MPCPGWPFRAAITLCVLFTTSYWALPFPYVPCARVKWALGLTLGLPPLL